MTTSHDNLFVDFSKEPNTPASNMFRENLLYQEEQPGRMKQRLPTVQEKVVGFAHLSMGQGSIMSGVFTLVASAMGAGCLSLPHMLRQSGLALGLLLLGIGAILAHLSLVVLMSCARYTRCKSFAELVAQCQETSDHASMERSMMVVDTVIAFYGVAAVLIYLMLIGNFLGGIAQSPAFGQSSVSRESLILGSLLVIFPLSLPRKVSALRHVCILSTGAILFMALVVLIKAHGTVFNRDSTVLDEPIDNIKWFAGSFRDTLQSFSIAIFAFAAHTNAVPMVASLEEPRAVRIWTVSLLSVLVELVIYAVIATSGYLTFRSATRQDFIRNYPVDDNVMLFVRCVYTVPVVFGVPINLSPAAASLQALTKRAASRSASSKGSKPAWWQRLVHSCSEGMLHFILVSLVLGSCACLAICSESIADVIGLLGSFFGTLICLWWPGVIYRRVLRDLHPRRLACTLSSVLWAATALGVMAFILQAYGVLSQWTSATE